MHDACVMRACMRVCMLRVAHLDQSSHSRVLLVSSRFLFVKIKSSFDDRLSFASHRPELKIRRIESARLPQIRQGANFTRYPIACYYSCTTRHRRAHVIREIDRSQHLSPRGSPSRTMRENGDERRRLYIKIALKAGRPRYRFLAFKGL